MATLRITENDLRTLIRHINTLESHVNPQDSASVHNGELWNLDYFANYGVYIRRGHANPTHTSYRITPKEAFLFLTGIQYALDHIYQRMNKL